MCDTWFESESHKKTKNAKNITEFEIYGILWAENFWQKRPKSLIFYIPSNKCRKKVIVE